MRSKSKMNGKQMHPITVDTESYFSADYTLSKMSNEEYIRNPQFKLHCIGMKMGEAQGVYPTVTEGIKALLSANAVVLHHAQHDGLILTHHYGIVPKFYFCTLSMARLVFPHAKSHSLGALAAMLGLAEKTVPYDSFKGVRDLPADLYNRVATGCLNDVELTHAIFQKLLPYVAPEELRLIDYTIRMFTEPTLSLDRPRAQAYLEKVRAEKAASLSALGVTKADLQSAEKFSALLRSLGIDPPLKPSPKHPEKLIYAFAKTDDAMKELLEHDDTRVSTLCAARIGSKSTGGETRAQTLLDMHTRGALCVYLNYCGATTTRWSGGDGSNWQNFKRGSEIRYSILAPAGYSVCVADSSQVECRLLNWFAGQWDILDKFRNKEDIYSQLATQFYGETITKTKDNPDMEAKRGTGKQIELSCGFRAGADSIKETAKRGTYGPPVILSDEQALSARNLYRSTHPEVVKLWKYCDKVILPALYDGTQDFMWGHLRLRGKQIFMPSGVFIDYSHLHHGQQVDKYHKLRMQFYVRTRKGPRAIHGGIVTQNIIEMMSRAILANAMLKVAPSYKVVTCSHDELVYLAPERHAAEALEFGLNTMKTPPDWCAGIPLDAEGGFSERYNK